MAVTAGQRAPQFTLYSSELKEVSLSDYEGKKVVIHFFPMAFTGVCTSQLCTMRDDFGYYSGLSAEILAISVDSPFTLARFKEENHFQFPLLSDFNREVCQQYGAYYDEFVFGLKGVAKRAAFVVNGKQEILYAEVLEAAADLPNFEAIQKVVNT
ncbi:redoxin domain-containing protein [Arcticibacter sp. MXS-1]|uniref:redoxin domain-containing protein n=1 Tax=Arcticibacter sp. MXS-1 TaxID=3341726 RepID=UPI0035A964CE